MIMEICRLLVVMTMCYCGETGLSQFAADSDDDWRDADE